MIDGSSSGCMLSTMGSDVLAAVVFDVDGTLVDSERDGHRVAFNRAFAEFDLTDRWDEDTYGTLLAVSGGRRRLRHYFVERGHPEEQADDLAALVHERKTRLFTRMVTDGEIPPRPGVPRLLDELDEAGVPLAIATTGSRAWVEPLIDRLFGTQRFTALFTGDDVERRKPDPEVFERALSHLGTPPRRTVAVEDSHNGVVAAVSAGMPCLAVVNGYTRDEDLDGARLVVDRFGDPGRARTLSGPAHLLVDDAVRVETLVGLLGSDEGQPAPLPP